MRYKTKESDHKMALYLRAGKSQAQASLRITQNRKIVDEDMKLSMMMVMRSKK